MLLSCFAVNRLFNLGSVPFPSSVACLIILFAALLLSEQLLGEHRTKRIVAIIEIPVSYGVPLCSNLFPILIFSLG